MVIKDLAGLGKPLEKLIETVSNGTGVVGNHKFEFDKKRIERIGEANAKVKKMNLIAEAEGKAEAQIIKFETENKLLQRAQERLLLKEVKREANIDKTILVAKQDLESTSETVSDTPVDMDWTTRFFNIVQDVSNEEMQLIWGKILAGEIKKPKSFSLRTLETLRNIDAVDAKLFQKAVSLSFQHAFIIFKNSANDLKEYGLDYDKILQLQDAQLILSGLNIAKRFDLENTRLNMSPATDKLSVIFKEKKTLDVNILAFSKAGSEIAKLINTKTNSKYFADIKEHIKQKGFDVL